MLSKIISIVNFIHIFVLLSCSAQTPRSTFTNFIEAVQKNDVLKIVELDYDIANQLKDMFKSERENFVKKFADSLKYPGTSAYIEGGFEIKSCWYTPKVFFSPESKVEIVDALEKEEYGEKRTLLQVSVTYPEGTAPYYIKEVEVVWDEPKSYPGGLYIPKIKPIPAFTSGFFEYNHPFRNEPKYLGRYSTFDLSIEMKLVKKLLLTAEMIYDIKTKKWLIKKIIPDISKSMLE